VLRLARGAMAQLAVERLAAAELVLDLSAVAVGLVLGVKVLLLVVDAVRRALFPLGDAGRRLAAALIFVHLEGCLGEGGVLSREVGCEKTGTR
jgi:hypothetical protein